MSAEPEVARYRKIASPTLRLVQRALLWSMTLAAALYVFEAPSRLGFYFLEEQYLGIMLILVLVSTFIAVPASRRAP